VECGGKFFHADFAIRRDEDTDRLAVDLGHQRLQHAPRLDVERVRRLLADAFGAWIAGIAVERKYHAVVAERKRCAGTAGIQALCCVVFRTGNTLIPRDYFLRTRGRTRSKFKNPDLSLRVRISITRMLTPSQA
jgi:hypothetical protein